MVKIVRSKNTPQNKTVKILTGCSPIRRTCPNEDGGSGGNQNCVVGDVLTNSTIFSDTTYANAAGTVMVSMRFCSSSGEGPQEGNTAQRRVYTNSTDGSTCCGPNLGEGNERAEPPTGQEQIGECIKMCFSTGEAIQQECCCQELLNKLLSAHFARVIAKQEGT